MVFYSAYANVPQFGVELKGIQSAYKAKLISESGAPSSDHLCQAAHYSWQLSIPFYVTYASYASFYKVKPGRWHFYCNWDEGSFYFIRPDNGVRVRTVITADGIKRFYQLVLLQQQAKQLGPMYDPSPVFDGDPSYNKCKTCCFKEACNRYKEYDDFISACKLISEGKEL